MNSNWEMKLSHSESTSLGLKQHRPSLSYSSTLSFLIFHSSSPFLVSFYYLLCLFLLSSFTRGASVTTSSFPVLCHLSSCFYFNHMASCYLILPPFLSFFFLSPYLPCFLTMITGNLWRTSVLSYRNSLEAVLFVCIYSFCVCPSP